MTAIHLNIYIFMTQLYCVVPKVDATVKVADPAYNGPVDLVLDGIQTSVISSDGAAHYSVL